MNKKQTLKKAIHEFKRVYGKKKPHMKQLSNKQNKWIYHCDVDKKLLDKYCR